MFFFLYSSPNLNNFVSWSPLIFYLVPKQICQWATYKNVILLKNIVLFNKLILQVRVSAASARADERWRQEDEEEAAARMMRYAERQQKQI